jgi:ribonuclease HII
MPTLLHEKCYGFLDGKTVCGVDEVGRAPLAGPVTAAAVILPLQLPRAVRREIRDSKQMTTAQREALFEPLTRLCRYCVAEANVEEITQLNIFWASMLAMKRAIEGLGTAIDMALIDGNKVPKPLACQAIAIVAGDDKSLSIAAASIIAKVTRDRFMKKLAEAHPGYGWERNVGYPTAEHRQALKRLGPTPWHRPGFAPVAQQLEFDMAS